MATMFKGLSNNDVTSVRTLLHEAIPITGSILSGTYIDGDNTETNIKTYTHGMFQSVYDYPFLSSSANHLMDITAGYAAGSALSASGVDAAWEQDKKINIYNQMAQVLVGHDKNGNIQSFDQDGDIPSGGDKMESVFFLNFARLITKDEIKKGSFQIVLGVPSGSTPSGQLATTGSLLKIYDASGSDGYKVNSPAGEYGLLYATGSADSGEHTDAADKDTDALNDSGDNRVGPIGHIYYQAGVVVITSSIFLDDADNGFLADDHGSTEFLIDSGSTSVSAGVHADYLWQSGSIDTIGHSMRRHIKSLEFQNTTELNSSIYFCRLNHNEYNYSSNPTYLNGSKIRTKTSALQNPVAYLTTVGLYSADNELLAVAKVSEPLKKDPTNEITLRVRLDY